MTIVIHVDSDRGGDDQGSLRRGGRALLGLVECGSATTLRLDIECVCAHVSVYALNAKGEGLLMSTDNLPRVEDCTCLAVRQAARRITQFYDQHLPPFWLRTTQFSILAKLKH